MAQPRLLIRLGSLGDVVLATAAANAARASWGDNALDVLVKEEWAGVWEGHPAVRRTLLLKPGDRGFSGLNRWRKHIRETGYSEIFDLQASPRTQFLTGFSNAHRVRRAPRHNLARRRLVSWKRWGPPAGYRVAEAFVNTVVPGARAFPSLHPGDGAVSEAEIVLGGRGSRVALIPGARHATKRWPVERFVAVGKRVAAEHRRPVVVLLGPDDTALEKEWRTLWPGDDWMAVRASLPTAAAVLSRMAVVVTNDTGLMHVAAAVHTPVVALFGPTVAEFGFPPLGDGHTVAEMDMLECRPCSLHGSSRCPRGHFRCMLEIPVERVLTEVTRRLAAPRAEQRMQHL